MENSERTVSPKALTCFNFEEKPKRENSERTVSPKALRGSVKGKTQRGQYLQKP